MKRTKGFGPWRYDWFSLCSAHIEFNKDCPRCTAGEWRNHWRWFFSYTVYVMFPGFWRWWANKRWLK